jgi:hypothetical protein
MQYLKIKIFLIINLMFTIFILENLTSVGKWGEIQPGKANLTNCRILNSSFFGGTDD